MARTDTPKFVEEVEVAEYYLCEKFGYEAFPPTGLDQLWYTQILSSKKRALELLDLCMRKNPKPFFAKQFGPNCNVFNYLAPHVGYPVL